MGGESRTGKGRGAGESERGGDVNRRATRALSTVAVTVLGTALAVGPVAAAGAGGQGAKGHGGTTLKPVVTGIEGPRGLSIDRHGKTLVYATADGGIYRANAWSKNSGVRKIGQLAPGFAPAVDISPHGVVYALTGAGEPGTGAATLYKIRPGQSPKKIADIQAYQNKDLDPYNQEGLRNESNPFGLAALKDGTVLVADAAGNDLLRVWPNGHVKTVARLKPRVVKVPTGLPPTDPDGNPLPKPGTPIKAEAVATSVTVGSDGYWYVGELRGFPATAGSSQIWRIKPGSYGAVCDPYKPYKGRCTRYADGLTSIVELAGGPHKRIYAAQLADVSWLKFEMGGSPEGSLIEFSKGHRRELAKGQLNLPGGIAVSPGGTVYVAAPVFGPGSISKVVAKR